LRQDISSSSAALVLDLTAKCPSYALLLLLLLLLFNQAVAVGKPWVLDPVGCGATSYRTAACVAMLRQKPAVVRGNASEILALAGAAGAGAGAHCQQ
jgi:hydroxyethylthiazole kinase-like sugar kinase family protein